MIKIAFCDDDSIELNKICRLLDSYREKHSMELLYCTFQSPFDLLAEIEHGNCYDILFLDVLMPGETGIDAAAEIRKYDSNVKIIFLTSSSEFAVQSYVVGAYYYQLKPIEEESFFRLMDSVLSVCEKEQKESIILRCKSGITKLELQKLEYLEVLHHTLLIHMADGRILECSRSLDEMSRQLEPYGYFYRPHRSYLINLEYVKNLSYRGIIMSCRAEIPIPRGKYNETKDAYLEYAFQSRQLIM